MKYLIFYYDLIQRKYIYRLFNECESALEFREKLLKSGLSKTIYVYKLFGRKSVIL